MSTHQYQYWQQKSSISGALLSRSGAKNMHLFIELYYIYMVISLYMTLICTTAAGMIISFGSYPSGHLEDGGLRRHKVATVPGVAKVISLYWKCAVSTLF